MEGGGILKALLDTTVLIDLLKGEKSAINTVEKIRGEAVLYTSTINLYEILRGIHVLEKDRGKHLRALHTLSSNINVLDIDYESSERAARIYTELRKKGVEIDEPDYLIAGAALANGVSTIVSRNEKHFREISGLAVVSY